MAWGVLADVVVAVHLGFIAFAVLGGFLAWRWPRVVFAHLPCLGWATWVEATSQICPLTPLENRLRAMGGEAGYHGGFIEHYLVPLIYPAEITPRLQWTLTGILVGINLLAYGRLIARWRQRAQR
jgi:hypothetical protein